MRRLRVREDVPLALGWSGVTVRAHYGALPLARLDVVRAKAEKSVGWLSCGKAPSTRKNGPSTGKTSRWRAVRRCAVWARWRSSVERTASSPLKCALRRATSPSCLKGRNAYTSDAEAPRERERMISAMMWLFDRSIRQ